MVDTFINITKNLLLRFVNGKENVEYTFGFQFVEEMEQMLDDAKLGAYIRNEMPVGMAIAAGIGNHFDLFSVPIGGVKTFALLKRTCQDRWLQNSIKGHLSPEEALGLKEPEHIRAGVPQ